LASDCSRPNATPLACPIKRDFINARLNKHTPPGVSNHSWNSRGHCNCQDSREYPPQHMKFPQDLLSFLCLLMASWMNSAPARAADFQPDPVTVQRFDTGYRFPQAGWTVVHIEGDP